MAMKPADTLDVYISVRRVGELRHSPGGRLSFSYDDKWMTGRVAIPLSLSMPTITRTYDGKAVEAFLWGLLPDNEQTLARWAQRFQVSARNPFALLSRVGRDCAGAVQFLPPGDEISRGETFEPLADEQIGDRLRDLRRDGAATWRRRPVQPRRGPGQDRLPLRRFHRPVGHPAGRHACQFSAPSSPSTAFRRSALISRLSGFDPSSLPARAPARRHGPAR